jgi:hypothetical protein
VRSASTASVVQSTASAQSCSHRVTATPSQPSATLYPAMALPACMPRSITHCSCHAEKHSTASTTPVPTICKTTKQQPQNQIVKPRSSCSVYSAKHLHHHCLSHTHTQTKCNSCKVACKQSVLMKGTGHSEHCCINDAQQHATTPAAKLATVYSHTDFGTVTISVPEQPPPKRSRQHPQEEPLQDSHTLGTTTSCAVDAWRRKGKQHSNNTHNCKKL